MAQSRIEWTDETWNPIKARNLADGKIGHFCDKVSPGCKHCYASTWNKRGMSPAGTGLPYVIENRAKVEFFLDEKALLEPLRWKKPRQVFVESMSDLFGDWVPDEWISDVFAVMALCPQHTFQVLTKRAQRMRTCLTTGISSPSSELIQFIRPKQKHLDWHAVTTFSMPLPNVWLGVSGEDQKRADERIPELLATPAAVRFLSAEPLLGPMNLGSYIHGLDWVIVGGESGSGARSCNVQWIRDISLQCAVESIPCFVKQLGARPYEKRAVEEGYKGTNAALVNLGAEHPERQLYSPLDGWCLTHTPDGESAWYKSYTLSNKKGGDPEEWPEDLRIRQYPEVTA